MDNFKVYFKTFFFMVTVTTLQKTHALVLINFFLLFSSIPLSASVFYPLISFIYISYSFIFHLLYFHLFLLFQAQILRQNQSTGTIHCQPLDNFTAIIQFVEKKGNLIPSANIGIIYFYLEIKQVQTLVKFYRNKKRFMNRIEFYVLLYKDLHFTVVSPVHWTIFIVG